MLAAVSLVGGCSSSQDGATEAAAGASATTTAGTSTTAEPTETATEEPPDPATTMTVTFDGNGCQYDGPTELPAGMLTLQFVNDSDVEAGVSMTKLRDGVTVDDVRAFFAPERYEGQPDDDIRDPEQGWVGNRTMAGEEDRDYSFYAQPGEWVLVCGPFKAWTTSPVWVAGGVSVTE